MLHTVKNITHIGKYFKPLIVVILIITAYKTKFSVSENVYAGKVVAY